MYTILRTELFNQWLKRLKDNRAKARIVERIQSAERGNFGDRESVGNGVLEMRVHFVAGYRFILPVQVKLLMFCFVVVPSVGKSGI